MFTYMYIINMKTKLTDDELKQQAIVGTGNKART